MMNRDALIASAASAALCAAAVATCGAVAGRSMGLFFGGFAALALIAPATTAACGRGRAAPALVAAAVVSAAFLLANVISFRALAGCVSLAFTFALALAGVTALLARTRAAPALAAAVVTAASVAWLAWPIWTRGYGVDRLAAAHPLLAVNGAAEAFEPWTQLPVMYTLTALGQDVYVTLPRTVWPAVAAHAAVAVVAWALAVLPPRRRRAAEAGNVSQPTGGSPA